MERLNIAIDGPAGAGKSTIAKAVAKKLGILYLDTGAMYRALALKALRGGIDPNDAVRVVPMLPDTSVSVASENGMQRTYLDGEDVSDFIRTQEVAKGASDIGVIPEVRAKLAACQREIARGADVVMEGRDMGSYVIPDTPYKFYVTASSDERAERRLRETHAKGIDLDKTHEQIKREIEARDYTDTHRTVAPLTRMPDAVYIDTTGMSVGQAVDAVLSEIRRKSR